MRPGTTLAIDHRSAERRADTLPGRAAWKFREVPLSRVEDLKVAFAKLREQAAGLLLVQSAGGLVAYAPDILALWRRATTYVDRILRAKALGLTVHVDAAVLADTDQAGQSLLEDGMRVPAGTSQRLACDASRVVMRHDGDGRLLEVGARTRTVPPALRRALHHRDRGCRFPGCGVRFGQGHHIRHWAQGGPTTLSNLALLCRRHHRAVHEEGYQVDRQPDGTLRFRRPDGRLLPEAPPPPAVPAAPVHVLQARHLALGLRIHARTACSGWLGECLDVGWAIDGARPTLLC